MAKSDSKIQHAERLEQRLRDGEAEVLRLASAIDAAQGEWQKALAEGDDKRETSALKAMDAARMAHATALSRVPILREALQAARQAALPERVQAAEPALVAVNEQAMDLAAEVLQAVEAMDAGIAEILRLSVEHNKLVADLRKHATQAGTTLQIDRRASFPVNTRNAQHAAIQARQLRLQKNLLHPAVMESSA